MTTLTAPAVRRATGIALLTWGQIVFLLVCLAGWAAFAFYAPAPVSIDVFFFRDAALNWVLGDGFRTASLEKSVSFTPLLYSNYTPLSQWLFIPFAKLFGLGWRAASVHAVVLGAMTSWLVLRAGLRVATSSFKSWVLVLLTGVSIPFSFLLAETDRPEETTILILLLLLYALMPGRKGVLVYAAQGLLAGLAFLSEPFGGVAGVLLITGSVAARALVERRQGGGWARVINAAGVQPVCAAVLFAAPIAVTVACFQHQDPHALARFERHARLAGTNRVLDYGMSADTNLHESQEPKPTFSQKMDNGIRKQIALGPTHEIQFVNWGITFAIGVSLSLLYRRQRDRGWVVPALLVIGIVVPWITFPNQENYHVLGAALIPVALALGWAGFEARERGTRLVWVLFALPMLFLLPNVALQTLSRAETRASAMDAVQQAWYTSVYLEAHGLGNSVLMVPPGGYYFYKPFHHNLYNPGYYSHAEDPGQIGGVARCKSASKDFSDTPLPPDFPGNWKLLLRAGEPVRVTLLGHQLMRRNWSYACDVYVRADPGPTAAAPAQEPVK